MSSENAVSGFRRGSLLVMGISLLVAGVLLVAFQGRQREPTKVDAARASGLPDGAWVEMQGTVELDSLVGTEGPLVAGKFHAFQLKEDSGGIIVLTTAARHPAFKELVGDALGFLLEPSRTPSAAKSLTSSTIEFFTKPQTWSGVLASPGLLSSGEVELEDEKFKVAGFNSYCLAKGIHCPPNPRVLLARAEPKAGLALAFGAIVALLMAAAGAFGALRAKVLGPAWAAASREADREIAAEQAFGIGAGGRVVVHAPDGNQYPATVVDVQNGSCLCTMPNGQAHWFPFNLIAPLA